MTNRSTPAATTVSYSSCVRCGVRAPATVTPAGADLGEAIAHELGLDRLGVQLLHAPRRGGLLERGDLGEQRLGVVVAGPESLEVEHAEAAELAEHDRGPRADDRVHRRAEHGDRELERVDRPGGRDVLGIARAPRGHDRDVVERIGATRALGAAELDLHAHGISLPGGIGHDAGARTRNACEDRGMSERVPVVVIGGGVMGLSTAWALTRRGERPVVLERFARGHTHGASHGATRNFNNAYADEHYLDLLARAREGWDALGTPDGEPLLRLHGLVSHGSGAALGRHRRRPDRDPRAAARARHPRRSARRRRGIAPLAGHEVRRHRAVLARRRRRPRGGRARRARAAHRRRGRRGAVEHACAADRRGFRRRHGAHGRGRRAAPTPSS